MTQSTEVTRRAVLTAIASGSTRVPEIVSETGLSTTTVNTRLKELEAAGDIEVRARRGRAGSQIRLLRRLDLPVDPRGVPHGDREISTRLPVAVVWVKAALAHQSDASADLEAAGADAVFDCAGEFDLLALYPASSAHAALDLARDLASRKTLEHVHYGMIVGRAT